MTTQNEHRRIPTMTEEYEQLVLYSFVTWYVIEENSTLREASTHAYIVARDAVARLPWTDVVTLMEEHPEWSRREVETNATEKFPITINEIARRLFMQHLEAIIQRWGLMSVCTVKAPR